jgi:hypothetical protein
MEISSWAVQNTEYVRVPAPERHDMKMAPHVPEVGIASPVPETESVCLARRFMDRANPI